MSVARFIADQRTFYRVPVAVCCAILGLSVGWFYKWVKAPVTGPGGGAEWLLVRWAPEQRLPPARAHIGM